MKRLTILTLTVSSYFSQRVAVSASASVGGACRGGGGFQKYDADSAR